MGPLSIVASQNIGELGPRESGPAVFHWRWYYHVPSLALWGLLALLLVLVKDNRCGQAWLILLPVLAVSLGWSMLARLLFLPPQTAEPVGGFLVALAASWAAVWLLAPWLARRRVAAALPLALAAMLAVGGVFFLSVHDIGSADEVVVFAVLHVAGALALLSATALSAFSCRKEYRPRRFMAWLALWMTVVPMLSIPVVALVVGAFAADGLLEFVTMFIMVIVSSLIGGSWLGAVLYLLNLPFLLLAMRNPFFGTRFQRVLRLTPAAPTAMSVARTAGDLPVLDAVLVTTTEE